MKTKTHDELASILEQPQVDSVAIREAARRLRRIDLDQLMIAAETVAAIHASPLIDANSAQFAEKLVLATPINYRVVSEGRISSLATRVLNGCSYTHLDVLSLASLLVSKDE